MLRQLFDNVGSLGMYVSDDPAIVIIDEQLNKYDELSLEPFAPTTQDIVNLWEKALEEYYKDCPFNAEGFKEIEMNALLRKAAPNFAVLPSITQLSIEKVLLESL